MALPNFTFIPSADPSGAVSVPVDQIPQEVKDICEEIYAALKANPNGRMGVQFPTKGELAAFTAHANSYCNGRPAELGGPIRFRKSPARGIGETEMQFRITDIPATTTETEGIKAQIAAVNAPAAPAPAKAARTRK